jgi:hypothetical protein
LGGVRGDRQAQTAIRAGEWEQAAKECDIALDIAPVFRIEDIDEISVDSHAHWERPTRADHLVEEQVVAVDCEDRHAVTASVHGVKGAIALVVGERTLGCEVIDRRAVQYTA